MRLNELLHKAEEKKQERKSELDWNQKSVIQMKEFFLEEDKELTEKGIKNAFQYLENNVIENKKKNKEQGNVSKEELLKAYQICSNMEEALSFEERDIYRSKPAYLFETKIKASDAQEINHFMEHFMSQMHYSKGGMHEIEFAAMSHKRIVDICPFQKHNTFMAFWLLNRILRSYDYPIVLITKENFQMYKNVYFETRSMNNPNIDEFISFIAKCIIESDMY